MKPKTRLQKEVFSLHEKLPKVSGLYAAWAYRKLFKFYAWKTKHKASCFECGHSWDLESSLITKLFSIKCPKCGKELQARETKHHSFEEIEYFQVLKTVGRFQVQRMFQVKHYCSKGYKAVYTCKEIFQHWLDEKGKITTVALSSYVMAFAYNDHSSWDYFRPMEIKNGEHDRYWITASIYPKFELLPILYRNGFSGEYHNFNPIWFFSVLLTNSMFETLLKAGQFEIMKDSARSYSKVPLMWKQIKICIRHNYPVKDFPSWIDHIDMLKEFGMDIHNPKYICPDNFSEAHNALIERKRIIDEHRLEVERKKDEYNNLLLRNTKKGMMNISIVQSNISIVPLKTVKDFKEEEKIHDHCVYTRNYHKKDTSLILSARVNGIRTETIEISLQDLTVLQCRGFKNEDSEYHRDILKALEKNMPMIKSIYSKSRKAAYIKIRKKSLAK